MSKKDCYCCKVFCFYMKIYTLSSRYTKNISDICSLYLYYLKYTFLYKTTLFPIFSGKFLQDILSTVILKGTDSNWMWKGKHFLILQCK